jgi:hypothetical protein
MDEAMTHDRCSELLGGYVRGELERAEAEGVREHLSECEECRAEHRALTTLLGDAGEVRPMDDMERARLHRGLAQELFTPRANADVAGAGSGGGAPRWAKWVVPAVASAAVLGAVFVMATGGGSDEATQFSAEAEGGAEDAGSSLDALRDSDEGSGAGGRTSRGGGGSQAGDEPKRSVAAASAPDGNSFSLASGAAPEFAGDLGSPTTEDLASIGRSGEPFAAFAERYGPADVPRLYDRFLDALTDAAGGLGREIEDCATAVQDGSVLPAFAARAEYEGRDVVVLGFAASDPDSERLGRFLLWVWEPGSCEEPVDTLFGDIDAG